MRVVIKSMLQALKKISNIKVLTLLSKQPKFMFSGGHDDHHHEYDRDKITLRDKKSGKNNLTKAIT